MGECLSIYLSYEEHSRKVACFLFEFFEVGSISYKNEVDVFILLTEFFVEFKEEIDIFVF